MCKTRRQFSEDWTNSSGDMFAAVDRQRDTHIHIPAHRTNTLAMVTVWFNLVHYGPCTTAFSIHGVTVTQFCSISMPIDFCRHLVGKNSEKRLSL